MYGINGSLGNVLIPVDMEFVTIPERSWSTKVSEEYVVDPILLLRFVMIAVTVKENALLRPLADC